MHHHHDRSDDIIYQLHDNGRIDVGAHIGAVQLVGDDRRAALERIRAAINRELAAGSDVRRHDQPTELGPGGDLDRLRDAANYVATHGHGYEIPQWFWLILGHASLPTVIVDALTEDGAE